MTYNKVVRKVAVLKTSTAHSLIELSERQWNRLQNRSILLTEMVTHQGKNNRVEYKKYELGAELSFRRKKGKSSSVNMQWRTPMLANSNSNCMLIIGNKTEILSSNPDVIVATGR